LDEIVISIDSLITGQGAAEAHSLLLQYQSLLDHLNVSYSPDEENHKITAEGYGIATLFQGEAGIHLFYIGHQSPLPIRVKIRPWHKETAQQWQVIRLYDGKKTITDLRTRFMNAVNLTPPEFKLILYAGLPQDIRAAIAP
jgi:ATP-dependent Clp protease ATP-binding subunit ClpC